MIPVLAGGAEGLEMKFVGTVLVLDGAFVVEVVDEGMDLAAVEVEEVDPLAEEVVSVP